MMKLLRHQSQTVLVVVLAVIGLGFLFYGSSGNLLTNSGQPGNGDTGEINGSNISYAELVGAVRDARNSMIINGQGEQLKQAGGKAQLTQEAWRQLLLLAEADKLHIAPTDEQVADYIRNQPIFQDPKTGQFSPELYQQRLSVIQIMLNAPVSPEPNPMAATESAFEKVVRNNIRLKTVFGALFTTVRGPATDVLPRYEKVAGAAQVSLITFDAKAFADAAQVTDAEIEAAYKSHPENAALRTKEKRKVDYVLFMLTPEQMKLSDEEKRAAKNALGEKAIQLAMACLPEPSEHPGTAPTPPADFVKEAKKEGLNPVTSDFFTADAPPANVPPSSAFNSTAFNLTKDNTVSKVVDLEDGVAVMHLVEIQPSDLLPLAAVKPFITGELKKEKGMQAEGQAAAKASQDLKAALAKGTDFKTAAAALKLKVETIPPVIPLKVTGEDERQQTIAYVVTTLNPGDVSGPVPAGENQIVLVHLDSRDKPDPAGLVDFEMHFRQSEDQQLRGAVYMDWVNWASKQPGTHPPAELEAYGSVD